MYPLPSLVLWLLIGLHGIEPAAAMADPAATGVLFSVENLVALLTLTALEIVLGIDNIVFISILAGKLPRGAAAARAPRWAWRWRWSCASLLLLSLTWIMRLTAPLFTHRRLGQFSGRDLILLVGGLFLIAKSTYEIHDKLEGEDEHAGRRAAAVVRAVVVQIMLLDIVFSLDSVITAVGMAQHVSVMIAAVVIAVVLS